MAFIHHNRQNSDAISRFVKDLERLAYGLFIRRADINERIRRYGEVLNVIEQGDAVWNDDGPLQLSANEKTQIRDILDGPIYNASARAASAAIEAGQFIGRRRRNVRPFESSLSSTCCHKLSRKTLDGCDGSRIKSLESIGLIDYLT